MARRPTKALAKKFASLSGPANPKREECMIAVAWTGLNDERDAREGGRGHLMMRDRVLADLGLDRAPVPGFTNDEMQEIAFAAKVAALRCLERRRTTNRKAKPMTAPTDKLIRVDVLAGVAMAARGLSRGIAAGIVPDRTIPIGAAFRRACRYLAENGPQPADAVGAVVWAGKKRGKTSSMGGGGDYAAQMLLGRMKKAGLVRHAPSEGSTRWEVTALGRKEATP